MGGFFALAPMFAPEWLSTWFFVAAIGALILGSTRVAIILAAWPLIDWFVVPLFEPMLGQIPFAWLVVFLILLGFAIARPLFEFVFGRQVTGHVLGTYVVRLLDLILLGPFRLLRYLISRH